MLTETPKRVPTPDTTNRVWPTYYAGYSAEFVRDAISNLGLARGACVVDPWNGSGTTTSVARARGIESYGYDINPAVVLMAKARLLGADVLPSVDPLGRAVVADAKKSLGPPLDVEPLERWFTPDSAVAFRQIETSIRRHLVPKHAGCLSTASSLIHVSTLAAFYYVSLFRALRSFLTPFHGSNPTWVRSPATHRHRLRPSFDDLAAAFVRELAASKFLATPEGNATPRKVSTTIDVSDSAALPLATESVDAVIASPPYCTRIDYAVATWPELSLLGMTEPIFQKLRQRTIGSCLSPNVAPVKNADWGKTCRRLLAGIKRHPSHGSRTYYYRNHVAYFDSLHRSLEETWRILKPSGKSVLVVQDSHYKELHTDLQQIVTEMMEGIGFQLQHRTDFHIPRTKAAVNTRSRLYRTSVHATESTLVFSCARS
ncbi:MAG: hypothetical protein EOO73_29350 [Myxococcales bacterium]|nr:MAG: hypothetical protein EOO73_29350 [Myxococcales bacterium]